MKKVAKNIFSILTDREKRRFTAITIADIVINILDVLFLALLIVIVNEYTAPGHPSTFLRLPAEIIRNNFYPVIVIFFLLFSLKNLFGFFVLRGQNHFVYDVALRISRDTLSAYLSADYDHYAHTNSSVHIRKIGQQAIQFGQYVLLNFQQMITQSFLIAITVLMILLFNAKLFLLVVLIIIPPVILTAWLMKKKLQSLRSHAKTNSEKSTQHLYEALNGYVESIVHEKNSFFTKRFEEFQKKMNRYIADQQTIQGFPPRLIEIFAILGLCVLIFVGKQYGSSGTPVLLVGAFMGAAYKVIPAIVKILNSAGQIRAYHFTITDLLDNSYVPMALHNGQIANMVSAEFEDVCFSFNGSAILKDLNFSIHKGDFVGISGISGKGKTTIINLLIGFLQPSEGHIRINNAVCEKNARFSFIKNITYVKQEPFFIHDTLLKNILFDEENYDRVRLDKIIRASGINQIIDAHPEGLQYIIEENGKNISGGERQRIAFARSLYKQADCMILDEPFTELDEASEINMIKYLQQFAKQGRIILLITHNKNSFRYCNKIISLDD